MGEETRARVLNIEIGTEEEVPNPSNDDDIPKDTFVDRMKLSVGKIIRVIETEDGDFKDIATGYFYHPSWLELIEDTEQYQDTEIMEKVDRRTK